MTKAEHDLMQTNRQPLKPRMNAAVDEPWRSDLRDTERDPEQNQPRIADLGRGSLQDQPVLSYVQCLKLFREMT
jgi:hypothetical protein